VNQEGRLTSVLREKRRTSWTGALLIAGILMVANFLFSFIPARLDFSQGGAYSLSAGTKKLLKDLDDPLIVRAMFSKDLPPRLKINEQYVRDLLQEYKRAAHGKIRIEHFDPSASVKTKQEAIAAGVYPVQLDVIERDKREIKESFMGLSFLYGDKKETISFVQDAQGLEYEITQRIKKLVHPKQIKLGFMNGAGALTLESEALKMLADPLRQLYETVSVDPEKEIPPDVKSLWLIGPTQALSAKAVDNLRSFVQNGGVAGLLLDRFGIDIQSFRPHPVSSGLDDLLKEWGLEQRTALVVDPRCDRIQLRTNQGMFSMINIVDYPYFPMSMDLDRENPATKPIDAVSFPFVSPIFAANPVTGLVYTPLVKSSPRSWLDSMGFNVSPLQDHPKPADAASGPFNLGMLVEGKFKKDDPNSPVGRVILFGCSRFVRTDYPPKQSNFNLFFNLLDWSGQDEFLLGIRSKGVSSRPLKQIPDAARPVLKILLMLTLPLICLAAGFVVWTQSKRRTTQLISAYTSGS
jgi:gliding-associated putative ABC transporter substrate-binding component GldG